VVLRLGLGGADLVYPLRLFDFDQNTKCVKSRLQAHDRQSCVGRKKKTTYVVLAVCTTGN